MTPSASDSIFFALVLFLLCLPLAFGRVEPNRIYGVRTRATLRDPALWAAVNRYFGRLGLVASAATALLAYVPSDEQTALWLELARVLGPFLVVVALTLWYQGRLRTRRDQPT